MHAPSIFIYFTSVYAITVEIIAVIKYIKVCIPVFLIAINIADNIVLKLYSIEPITIIIIPIKYGLRFIPYTSPNTGTSRKYAHITTIIPNMKFIPTNFINIFFRFVYSLFFMYSDILVKDG